MAYMHKKTFDIIQGSNIDNLLNDYFEVDDMIALPIQQLNRKGYTTTFCCCGHPFVNVKEAFIHSKYDDYYSVIPGTYKVEELDNGIHRALIKDYSSKETYISFVEAVELPIIPEGFIYEDYILTKQYNEFSEYQFFKELLNTMSLLNEWAKQLPYLNR